VQTEDDVVITAAHGFHIEGVLNFVLTKW